MYTQLIQPVPNAIPIIDLSSNNEDDQRQIDWSLLAPYILNVHPQAGVIVKVSQGNWYVNPYLHRQRFGAHSHGIVNVGLYHYVEVIASSGPSIGKGLSGSDNAAFLLKCIGDDSGILPNEFLAGDWEDNVLPTADLGAMAYDFCDRLRYDLGIGPLLYSGEWFANPHGLERDKRLADFFLWWASYQSILPPVPEPWASAGKGIACWQFTDHASLPGVPYNVDVSWWLAGLSALRSAQWGNQPDPVAGKPAVGQPNLDPNGDLSSDLTSVYNYVMSGAPDWRTVAADIAAIKTKFIGLQG